MVRDYHTHSTASDGSLSPLELLDLALANGVEELAITDHDTCAGCQQALLALADRGNTTEQAETPQHRIRLISGVELSAGWGSLGVHIVGLHINMDHPVLRQAFVEQQQVRLQRAEEISRRLKKVGIPEAMEGARRYMRGEQLSRLHFAEYLMANGYARSKQAAFKKYLGTGTAGDVRNIWPDMEQVIAWIDQSGGIAVLAHPLQYRLTARRLGQLVQDFAEAGGKAMEIAVPGANLQTMRNLTGLAGQYDLLASQGSDFHAPASKWQQVGCAPNLPEEAIPVWKYWQ